MPKFSWKFWWRGRSNTPPTSSQLTTIDILTVSATNEAGTLTQTPISPVRIYVWWWSAWSLVYIEGVHFSISWWVVTFNPVATWFDVVTWDIVWAEYQYLWTSATPQQYVVESVSVTATNVLANITNTPTSLVVLIVNWLSYIESVHFTRSGTALTRLPLVNWFDLVTTDQVFAVYYY